MVIAIRVFLSLKKKRFYGYNILYEVFDVHMVSSWSFFAVGQETLWLPSLSHNAVITKTKYFKSKGMEFHVC